MELKLENLINKEKSKSCLILGPGETMMDFPFKKFNGKIIVIGTAALRGKGMFVPDYWVISNNHFPVPYLSLHRKIINNFNKTIFLFAESTLHDYLWKKSINTVKKLLKVKWVFYDERHFDFKKCIPEKKCCKYINKKKNYSTIQELVSKIYKHNSRATLGGSVFEHALALALIMGFSKIYIQGVDLPTKANKNLIKKKLDDAEYNRELGYRYTTSINPKFLAEIREIYRETKELIGKKNNEIFYEQNNILIYYFYLIGKYIKKILIKSTYPLFKDEILIMLKNIKIYSDIAKKNKIKIYNLSKKSNLNKVKNITYLKKYSS